MELTGSRGDGVALSGTQMPKDDERWQKENLVLVKDGDFGGTCNAAQRGVSFGGSHHASSKHYGPWFRPRFKFLGHFLQLVYYQVEAREREEIDRPKSGTGIGSQEHQAEKLPGNRD